MSMTRASVIRDYIVDYINSDLSKYEGITLNAEELQCIVIFLEERELYRAIGKVEEVQWMISTYNDMMHDFGDDMLALKEYRAIGTVSEFRELKEKATAKKPFGEPSGWTCPNCGEFHSEKQNHCTECNQAILWT